jgi:hypothetical protein
MNTKTNVMNFLTADDRAKLRGAEEVCKKHGEIVANATSALASAEADAAEDPSSAKITKARDMRRAFEEAAHGQTLAHQHRSKVTADFAAKKSAAIKEEIARRESSLTEVTDDDALMTTVEIAVLATDLRQRNEARAAQRRVELEELKELHALVGSTPPAIPSLESMVVTAIMREAEIGLSVQAQLGMRATLASRPVHQLLPFWREGNTDQGAVQEVLTGTERFFVHGATADGQPITSGKDRTSLVEEARALLKRVLAIGADDRDRLRYNGMPRSTALARVAGVAAAGATLVALAAAAVTLGGLS